jgi:hypothetical protein
MSCLAQGMSDETIHDTILQWPGEAAQPVEDGRVEAGRNDVGRCAMPSRIARATNSGDFVETFRPTISMR